MSRQRALVALALVLDFACPTRASAESRASAGSAAARGFYYSDDQGLTVITAAVELNERVAPGVTLVGHALVDHLTAHASGAALQASQNRLTGHDVDVVTSASVILAGGSTLEKTRYEGVAGAAVDTTVEGAPLRIEPVLRVSSEPDYVSFAGRLRATIDLAERNTSLSAFGGYGYDTSDPTTIPPGEKHRWPATQERWTWGFSVTQILSRDIVASGGIGVSRLFGVLENPYRRAEVITTLFPERLPGVRERMTGFVGISARLGRGTALHVRQGVYRDSWGVIGWIPEVALSKAFGARLSGSLRYRYYRQTAATFYEPVYERIERFLSGDVRLGRVGEHSPGARIEWVPVGPPAGPGSLTFDGSYDLSLMTYENIDRRVVAHIAAVGVTLPW